MAQTLIYICQSCDRNALQAADARSRGEVLTKELRAYISETEPDGLRVREVACLNGCLKPCNVALRGRDRFTYRFSCVEAVDIVALVEFANNYWSDQAGAIDVNKMAENLRGKMTVCTPPRGRW